MGYIYLICDPERELYKIGVTRNKDSNRIKKLQTGNPSELHVIYWFKCDYPFRLETMLHNYYKNNNTINEWFDLSDNDIVDFISICEKFNDRINLLKSNPYFSRNLK